MGVLIAASEDVRTFPRDRALTVYRHGEEVTGLLLYGLRSPEQRPPAENVAEGWPVETDVASPWLLYGEGWAVDLWTLQLREIPRGSRWRALLESTLARLIAAGYAVAWFGLEGDFSDPPMLFDPKVMEAVYAAASPETGFLLRDDGIDDLRVLTDADLIRLRIPAVAIWTANGVESSPGG